MIESLFTGSCLTTMAFLEQSGQNREKVRIYFAHASSRTAVSMTTGLLVESAAIIFALTVPPRE